MTQNDSGTELPDIALGGLVDRPLLDAAPGLVVRPLQVDDVTERYVDGINEPEVRAFLIQPNVCKQDMASIRDYVTVNLAAEDAVLFGLFLDGLHCGNIRLSDISRREAWIGIALFDRTVWGRGVGTAALRSVAEFAAHELGVEKILAGISESNPRSIRAFERAGFVRLPADTCRKVEAGGAIWRFTS